MIKMRKKPKIGFKSSLPRTIYEDVVSELLGVGGNHYLGLTIHYYNCSGQNLYFRFTGSGPAGWTSGSVDLGLLADGAESFKDMFNFMYRTSPVWETTETLSFTLAGYTDAGYTNLYCTFTRQTTMIFIRRTDAEWTEDYFESFEGGVGGWAVVAEQEGHSADYQTIGVDNTHYVEPLLTGQALFVTYGGYYNGAYRERRWRIYKSLTTPNKNEVYAYIHIRLEADRPCGGVSYKVCFKHIKIWFGKYLVYIGQPYDGNTAEYVTRSRWYRIIVPLPANTTEELRIIIDAGINAGGTSAEAYTYIDCIRILSRD
jgi:hypothetical protein